MTSFKILLTGVVLLNACAHRTGVADNPHSSLPQPIFRSEIAVWVDYVTSLDAMSTKDLKAECERQRRTPERSWDEDLRCGLATALQLSKAHNYQKASEALASTVGKVQGNGDLRAWLKLYSQQLAASAQLEKDLLEEKRQRSELEKKLKALSDIERDISERSKNADMAHP